MFKDFVIVVSVILLSFFLLVMFDVVLIIMLRFILIFGDIMIGFLVGCVWFYQLFQLLNQWDCGECFYVWWLKCLVYER